MAAGSGTRMGSELPKQFLEINGRPVLRQTMEVFLEACPDISIVTVLPQSYIDYWKDYCLKNSFTYPQVIVQGGFTRFHSVRNALDRIPDGAVVAVHDGVRPLVSVSLIRDIFLKAETAPAVIPVIPCIDTMKVLASGELGLKAVPGQHVDRSLLYGAQTPQVFHSELIKAAYSLPYDTSFTDDASVVEKYGKSLSYVDGERLNIKITTREDLLLAAAVMSLRKD